VTTAYASLVGPVAPVNAALASTAQPTISGTPAAGQTLTATAGSWTQSPPAVTYQWLRCNANGRLCTAIPGATAATYAVSSADSTHTLVVAVTASGTTPQTALTIHTAVVG
jgi:hypothetical protein